MKKLYEVRVEVTAYVMADDENDAMHAGREALEESAESGLEPSDVREVTHRNWALDGGWEPSNLVYGTDRDTTLKEVLDALPERKR